jgi:hypothetical protein
VLGMSLATLGMSLAAVGMSFTLSPHFGEYERRTFVDPMATL